MTYFVMPFRQNRARSAGFSAGSKCVASGNSQHLEKTAVIYKGGTIWKLNWQENCSTTYASITALQYKEEE
jgi:hypothetical protein